MGRMKNKNDTGSEEGGTPGEICFFCSKKYPIGEAVEIIQNRVQNFVDENR